MTIPYTGLFIAASCNSRSSHGQYTRSITKQLHSRLLGQNYRNLNQNTLVSACVALASSAGCKGCEVLPSSAASAEAKAASEAVAAAQLVQAVGLGAGWKRPATQTGQGSSPMSDLTWPDAQGTQAPCAGPASGARLALRGRARIPCDTAAVSECGAPREQRGLVRSSFPSLIISSFQTMFTVQPSIESLNTNKSSSSSVSGSSSSSP
jgi:hypothetical protein